MNALPSGKGGWVWHTPVVLGRVHQVKAMGLSYVYLKVSDGAGMFGGGGPLREMVVGLREFAITPCGWGYVRARAPGTEARVAAARVNALGLKAFALDVEIEFERAPQAESVAAVTEFCQAFRSQCPDVPIIASSFYRPSLHPRIPWQALRCLADGWAPQCYWEEHPAVPTVEEAMAEAKAMGKPVLITLPGYDQRSEGGDLPTAEQIVGATKTAWAAGAHAVDFFSLDEAMNLPGVIEGITQAPARAGAC